MYTLVYEQRLKNSVQRSVCCESIVKYAHGGTWRPDKQQTLYIKIDLNCSYPGAYTNQFFSVTNCAKPKTYKSIETQTEKQQQPLIEVRKSERVGRKPTKFRYDDHVIPNELQSFSISATPDKSVLLNLGQDSACPPPAEMVAINNC